MRAVRLLLGASSLLFPVLAFAVTFPTPAGFVNDFADVLSSGVEVELQESIASYKSTTANELVVVTVPSLEGLSESEYATQLFDAWEIGEFGQNNGVLVLVAPVEHALWIQVGSGLADALPETMVQQIIQSQMLPGIRTGNYDTGVRNGVAALQAAAQGNPLPAPAAPEGGSSAVGWGIFGAFVVVIIILAVLGKKKGKKGGGTSLNGGSAGGASFGGGSATGSSGTGVKW